MKEEKEIKEYHKEYYKKWSKKYPEKKKQGQKRWREKNKEKLREDGKKYYNREYFRNYQKKLSWKQYYNTRRKNRYKINPKFRLDNCIGSMISTCLKGEKAGKCWEEIVGYTIEDLMKHLEKQFVSEMTWDNYGNYWTIDHKKAKSLFHYKNPEDKEFKECWALKNLQPMEKIENIKKGNRYI